MLREILILIVMAVGLILISVSTFSKIYCEFQNQQFCEAYGHDADEFSQQSSNFWAISLIAAASLSMTYFLIRYVRS